jgi:dihydroxyacetone kinase-like predicted kinase
VVSRHDATADPGTGSRPVLSGAPHASLRPREFADALGVAAEVLGDHAAALDRLAAGDDWGATPDEPGTGADLAATLAGASRAVAASGAADFAGLATALVRGARDAARGPAGRRLAGLFDGAAEVLRNADRLDGVRAALALEAGAERLAAADDGRRAGRLPAVAAAAADGALAAADDGADLGEVLVGAADAGLAELERGPEADPGLARRGTVDAAAAGFLLLLDALASVVTGEPLPAPPTEPPAPSAPAVHAYEVRCRIRPHEHCGPEEAEHLRAVWGELGQVVELEVGPDGWRAAVLTPRPGAAVEAVCDVGRPADLHIAVVEPSAGRR